MSPLYEVDVFYHSTFYVEAPDDAEAREMAEELEGDVRDAAAWTIDISLCPSDQVHSWDSVWVECDKWGWHSGDDYLALLDERDES
jgi:hypothetical protein